MCDEWVRGLSFGDLSFWCKEMSMWSAGVRNYCRWRRASDKILWARLTSGLEAGHKRRGGLWGVALYHKAA